MKNPILLLAAIALTGTAWSQTNVDNTAVNARDRDSQNLTPIDQSNDPADIKITADIRKMIVADDSLSMEAKNVKIITVSGVVTLRGPVETVKEKTTIVTHANHVKPKSVVDQLEVKKP